MARLFTLLRMGIPIEALVKVITFSGFIEGKYTVDVAKLLEPIVAMMITGEAKLEKYPLELIWVMLVMMNFLEIYQKLNII